MWNMISSPATPTVYLEQKSENFQSRNVTLSMPSQSKKIVFKIICNVAYQCQGHPVSMWCWPLTCNLEKCNSLRSPCGMYNLQRQLRYWHLLTTHCPCNLLPEPTSPKHEYREKLWGHPVTSSMTSSPLKKLLFILWDDLCISEVKLKLCLIFQNFQNGRHFEPDIFFTGSYTGSWIDQKDSHEHFRHFELWIDAVTEILTEINQFQNLTYIYCDLVTSSMRSWILIYIIVGIISWYICTRSLMMISLLVVKLSWKLLLFHI